MQYREMSPTIKKVVLIGARGNLGSAIFNALDKDPQFTVSVLTRKASNSTFPSHIKVYTVDDSYLAKDLLNVFTGQDAVVSTLSHGSYAKQIEIIDAAVAAGVKRFIPSDFGLDSLNPIGLAIQPIFKEKNDVVDYLRTVESKGLSWTSVANGIFFDWGLRKGFTGFNLSTCTALIYDSGDTKFSTTNLATIGAAVAAILRKPEETANKHVYISSFTTSQNEVLAALEKVTGEKWTIEHSTAAEVTQTGQEKLAMGDFSGALDIIKGLLYGKDTGANLSVHHKLANDLLELPKETVEETVERIVKE